MALLRAERVCEFIRTHSSVRYLRLATFCFDEKEQSVFNVDFNRFRSTVLAIFEFLSPREISGYSFEMDFL